MSVPFGEGLALWVVLSRVDRDRRAERSGLVNRIRDCLITWCNLLEFANSLG